VILAAVIANRNPFIYLNNMGSVMTSGGFFGAAAAAWVVFAFGSAARAEVSPWIASERGAVRLVAASSGVGQQRSLVFGLEFRLAPGWKTYWRVPGETGTPPRFDWDGSENLGEPAVIWPAPRRFTIVGMQSYGYAGRVILPLRAEVAAPGRGVSLRLHLRYAICREVCVPEEARLRLDLPAGPADATAHADAIAAFAARAPQPGDRHGWSVDAAHIVKPNGGAGPHVKLVIDLTSAAAPFEAPELLAEDGSGRSFGLAIAKLAPDRQRVRFVLPSYRADRAEPAAGAITLTVIDGALSGTFTVRAAAR
jgi:suppressor for copper-sensitivity B